MSYYAKIKGKDQIVTIDEFREKLTDPIDVLTYDRCQEALRSKKAMTSWVGALNELKELRDKIVVTNTLEIHIKWDETAIDEAITKELTDLFDPTKPSPPK